MTFRNILSLLKSCQVQKQSLLNVQERFSCSSRSLPATVRLLYTVRKTVPFLNCESDLKYFLFVASAFHLRPNQSNLFAHTRCRACASLALSRDSAHVFTRLRDPWLRDRMWKLFSNSSWIFLDNQIAQSTFIFSNDHRPPLWLILVILFANNHKWKVLLSPVGLKTALNKPKCIWSTPPPLSTFIFLKRIILR